MKLVDINRAVKQQVEDKLNSMRDIGSADMMRKLEAVRSALVKDRKSVV